MIILNMRLDVKTFYPQSDVTSGGLDLSLSHLSRQCCQPPSRQTYLIFFKILTTFLSYSQDFQNTWLLTLTLTKVSMESIESLSKVIVFINLDVNITRGPGRVTTIPISLLQLKGKNYYIGHISYVFINEFTLKGVFCYVTVINEGKRTDLTTWPKSGPKTFQMDCSVYRRSINSMQSSDKQHFLVFILLVGY